MKKSDIKWEPFDVNRIGIRKLVGEYILESTQVFPYAQCKIRVWFDMKRRYYVACSNIGVRDAGNNTVDIECGIGNIYEKSDHRRK